MLLYHLHFDVADVRGAEATWIQAGFPVVARFGFAGREHKRFEPDVGWDALSERGVRLRLVALERGAVNIVLMRARGRTRLGQIGFAVDEREHEGALERARALGLRTEINEARTFIRLERRLDLELTRAAAYAYGDGAVSELQLESLEVGCEDGPVVEARVSEILGGDVLGRLRFVAMSTGWPELLSCSLRGTAASRVSIPLL